MLLNIIKNLSWLDGHTLDEVIAELLKAKEQFGGAVIFDTSVRMAEFGDDNEAYITLRRNK